MITLFHSGSHIRWELSTSCHSQTLLPQLPPSWSRLAVSLSIVCCAGFIWSHCHACPSVGQCPLWVRGSFPPFTSHDIIFPQFSISVFCFSWALQLLAILYSECTLISSWKMGWKLKFGGNLYLAQQLWCCLGHSEPGSATTSGFLLLYTHKAVIAVSLSPTWTPKLKSRLRASVWQSSSCRRHLGWTKQVEFLSFSLCFPLSCSLCFK